MQQSTEKGLTGRHCLAGIENQPTVLRQDQSGQRTKTGIQNHGRLRPDREHFQYPRKPEDKIAQIVGRKQQNRCFSSCSGFRLSRITPGYRHRMGNSITACVTTIDQVSMNPAVVMDSVFTAAAWVVNQHDLPQSRHNYPD